MGGETEAHRDRGDNYWRRDRGTQKGGERKTN